MNQEATNSRSTTIPLIFIVLSILYWMGLAIFFSLQPAWAAAPLFFPPWVWSLPGFLMAIPAFFYPKKIVSVVLLALWLVFLFGFEDEPSAILRGVTHSWPAGNWEEMVQEDKGIRVITFNAAGRDLPTLEEAASLKPDIVLVQETPLPEAMQGIQTQLFGDNGSFYKQGDSCILASGRVTLSKKLPAELHYFLPVRIEWESGREMEVISLHLKAPIVRYDLWSPSCWSAHRENRERQKEQLREVMNYVNTLPQNLPVIVGGDFNIPSHLDFYSVLKPRLRDSFAIAGQGTGNTITNNSPLFRFDQIWVSEALTPLAVVTEVAANSDHRMVVCDLKLVQ